MTKVTVFGEQESKAEKKPIEFVYNYSSEGDCRTGAICRPKSYNEVCLLGKASNGMDLIVAWDYVDNVKMIYLGHWNDGVV